MPNSQNHDQQLCLGPPVGKRLKRKFLLFLGLTVLIFLLCNTLCCRKSDPFGSEFLIEKEEVARIPSPDSVVEAVVRKSNYSTRDSYYYELYIVPRGLKGPDGIPQISFRGERMVGFQGGWKRDTLFEIRYKEGLVHSFSNMWYTGGRIDSNYIVEIRLVPLTDHSLPTDLRCDK